MAEYQLKTGKVGKKWRKTNMKKSNFAALILGTIGMVFFALGMCMALIEEWGMFRQGVIAGVIGLVILLITLIVWRRMEGKETNRRSENT